MNKRHSSVALRSNASGLPLIEADQVCEACRTSGTVGKVVIAAHENVAEAIHRYCASCWPLESARHRARIKERLRHFMEPAFQVDDHDASPDDDSETTPGGQAVGERMESTRSSREQRESAAFSRVGATRVASFESATWHQVEDTVEKFQELLHMVQSGNVPTVDELEATARELATEIIAVADSRVGRMPSLVSSFLVDFGPDGDFGTPVSKATPAESRAAIHDAVAAAHASADEVIAAFDQELETLTVPTTETERAAVDAELVGMLEQLRAEIDVERSAEEAFKTQLKAAMQTGNHYGVMKLARNGEERAMRLHGLMTTIEDLEELHARLLKRTTEGSDSSGEPAPS